MKTFQVKAKPKIHEFGTVTNRIPAQILRKAKVSHVYTRH